MTQNNILYLLWLKSTSVASFAAALRRLPVAQLPKTFELPLAQFDPADRAAARREMRDLLLAALRFGLIRRSDKVRRFWALVSTPSSDLNAALEEMTLADAETIKSWLESREAANA